MRKLNICLIAAIAALAAPAAYAADDHALDGLEMKALHAGDTPNEASTKVLALPDEASDQAREHAQKGLDAANAAREGGAEFGTDTAEAAREDHGDARGDHGPPEGTPTGP